MLSFLVTGSYLTCRGDEMTDIIMTEKTIIKGWVVLPCFKVESRVSASGTEFEMVCNKVLCWIFENMFAWLWSGKINISKIYEGETEIKY